MLQHILEHVRLPLCRPKFLVNVGSDFYVTADEHCGDLVDKVKNYLLLPQERQSMQGPRTRQGKPIRFGEVLYAGLCYRFSYSVRKLIDFSYTVHNNFFKSVAGAVAMRSLASSATTRRRTSGVSSHQCRSAVSLFPVSSFSPFPCVSLSNLSPLPLPSVSLFPFSPFPRILYSHVSLSCVCERSFGRVNF